MEKSGNAAALPEKVFGGDNCGDLCLRGDISAGPPQSEMVLRFMI